ncbi:MAG: SDR family oxidoreductase [bacterium]
MPEWNDNDLLCYDLPSEPQPQIGKILVTGATGYIGGRLVPELVARDYDVRVMLRVASQEYAERWSNTEIVVADALELDKLREALDGIHTAYYLIHSLLLGPRRFESADIQAAINFRKAAEEKKVKRIIYLGGLGDIQSTLSPHLRSRAQVAEELRRGTVPTTILRAAVIIGSGSAPYEILKSLVENSPILFIPYWARTNCQPVSIRDLVKVLVGALESKQTSGKSFDVGGNEVLTYEMMMKSLAKILGKKRVFIQTFFNNIRFYSYVASLLTPVPASVVRSLMASCQNEVVCQNDNIKRILAFQPITFKESILRAMSREELDAVHTRWSDDFPRAHELALKLHELETPPAYKCSYSLITNKTASALFRSICKIGGDEGWLHGNWMWNLRGTLDRMLLGVGISRGRRSSSHLRVHDVVDFWRVEALKKNHSLLLRAEMKLPGKAWLEFKISREEDKNRLYINAYYDPRGVAGKVYWYIFLPFHHFIFNNLIIQIEKRS